MTPNVEYISFECNHFVEADHNDPDEREAIAYADVDGFPANDNEEGTVICRVWMFRNRGTNAHLQKFNFVVDWHYNAYRGRNEIKALISQAKEELKKFFTDVMVERVFQIAYGKYKLQWMVDHGYSLVDLVDKMQVQMANGAKTVKEALAKFEELSDFNGDLWDSEVEFRCDDWKNEAVMQKLLNGNEYSIWRDQ